MINFKDFHDIEELFNRNRMLLNMLIWYCGHDIEKTEEKEETLSVLQILELISEGESKIEKLIESSFEKLMQKS